MFRMGFRGSVVAAAVRVVVTRRVNVLGAAKVLVDGMVAYGILREFSVV